MGSVSSTPDTLTVGIGVQTRGRAAQEALDANSRLATATIDALRAAGVAEADLQTSQLSVSPTQDPTSGRITGYEVSNLLTATLHDVGRAGAVIDAAGTAAGDAVRVQQLEFSVADDSAPRARARADAVRQAQEQARQLAEAAGVTLGAVRSITELPPTSRVPYKRDRRRGAGGRADPARHPGAAGHRGGRLRRPLSREPDSRARPAHSVRCGASQSVGRRGLGGRRGEDRGVEGGTGRAGCC